MFTVTNTTTRPSTSIVWFAEHPDNTTEAAVLENSRNVPEILSFSSSVSSDGLTLTKIFTFNSYNEYQSWVQKVRTSDPALFEKRNKYVTDNGFTLRIETTDGVTPVVEKLL
jgi:hypothetical protein